MIFWTRDVTGKLSCPYCKSSRLQYKVIDRMHAEYKEGEADTAEYFDTVRDYACLNCDMNFLVPDDELTDL